MENSIALYLFQNKKCPLPGVGCLELLYGSAYISASEKIAIAPKPSIYLSDPERCNSPEDLERFIADLENIPIWEAKNKLTDFCRSILSLPLHEEFSLASVGVFYKDPSNKTGFRPTNLPKTFAPDIKAEKVIHPNESHEMIVGDKQTTTAAMTEFYSEKTGSGKSRWWIAALIIALLSLITILYFIGKTNQRYSGNAQPVLPNTLTESYQLK